MTTFIDIDIDVSVTARISTAIRATRFNDKYSMPAGICGYNDVAIGSCWCLWRTIVDFRMPLLSTRCGLTTANDQIGQG